MTNNYLLGFLNGSKIVLTIILGILGVSTSSTWLHQLAFSPWDLKLLASTGFLVLLISTIISFWWKYERLLGFWTMAGWMVYGLFATPKDNWWYFFWVIPPILILIANLATKQTNKPA